jgi:hypothetical protein
LVLDVSDVRWAGAVVVVAARRQGAVCRRAVVECVRQTCRHCCGRFSGRPWASIACVGPLRVVQRLPRWGSNDARSLLHGRGQISRRSNPNPSSAMLDAAPGETAVSGPRNVTARHRHWHLVQLHPIIND